MPTALRTPPVNLVSESKPKRICTLSRSTPGKYGASLLLLHGVRLMCSVGSGPGAGTGFCGSGGDRIANRRPDASFQFYMAKRITGAQPRAGCIVGHPRVLMSRV